VRLAGSAEVEERVDADEHHVRGLGRVFLADPVIRTLLEAGLGADVAVGTMHAITRWAVRVVGAGGPEVRRKLAGGLVPGAALVELIRQDLPYIFSRRAVLATPLVPGEHPGIAFSWDVRRIPVRRADRRGVATTPGPDEQRQDYS